MTATDLDRRERELIDAAAVGMTISVWAAHRPDSIAVYDPDGTPHTYAEVNANANRLARLLREADLRPGDAVAQAVSNRMEYIEILFACLRGGFRLTPINWHLTADEIGYILNDCDAKAFFCDARVMDPQAAVAHAPKATLKIAVGGAIASFLDYAAELNHFDPSDIADPVLGTGMLYTSGTTGRPKGVYRPTAVPVSRAQCKDRLLDETSIAMCAGPSYHAAPLAFDIRFPMEAGATVVLMDKWDTERTLRTMVEYGVTHAHMVPIMFQRLLALPSEVRARHDLSRIKYLLHGAAPCPPEVKHAMIDWVGPIIHEYYGGSEGGSGYLIDSHDWLRKPGSVGKRPVALGSKILGDDGLECPPNVSGRIYQQVPPTVGFSYYKDETKTQANRVGDYFTMGDIGYFDDEGFLFLTGRSAETIIAGGVNIYPVEIDNELLKHPAVADSSTIGVPHDEWGEQVKAVILLRPGYEPSPALAEEILDLARVALPAFKTPRSLDFVADLPRSEAGKVLRDKVRAPYWQGRTRQI